MYIHVEFMIAAVCSRAQKAHMHTRENKINKHITRNTRPINSPENICVLNICVVLRLLVDSQNDSSHVNKLLIAYLTQYVVLFSSVNMI